MYCSVSEYTWRNTIFFVEGETISLLTAHSHTTLNVQDTEWACRIADAPYASYPLARGVLLLILTPCTSQEYIHMFMYIV